MILLTGASGFLGKIIKRSLETEGEQTITLGRQNADIIASLTAQTPTLPYCDLVIHVAGKAHVVPKNAAQHKQFFDVNVKGTQNLLNALGNSQTFPKYFVFISSVSVYGLESGSFINENAPPLAEDAYGKSKIEAEKIIKEWCSKNGVVCTILRLPLLVGTNPPGNLGSMIKGIKKGYYFNIGSGKARKSMVLAEDVAKIITKVAPIGGIYNLTDRYHPSFEELSLVIANQLNKSKPTSMPLLVARILAEIGNLLGNKAPINTKKLNKIISDLTFDDSKAVENFGWNPTLVLKGFQINQKKH